MRVRYLFLLTVAAFSGGPLSAGSGQEEETRIHLFFTGDVRGTFEPCGCPAGPTGGLARRAGYAQSVSRLKGGLQLHVDAGNYFEIPGPHAAAINGFMIESLTRLPISVLNLGSEDLFWWSDLAKTSFPHTRIISTNLVPRRETLPSPEPYAVVEIPSGNPTGGEPLRIGFLGLADPARVKPNSGFRALDPLEAVRRVKAEVAQRSDVLIVLWDIFRPQQGIPADSPIRRLAEEHDDIRFIITTEQGFLLHDPTPVNRAMVLSSVHWGRYLGELILELTSSGELLASEVRFEEMKEGVPEDPVLRAEQDRLSARIPQPQWWQ